MISPSVIKPNPALITLLHGCTQTLFQVKGQTHLEKYIKEKNYILLLPSQSLLHNPMKCWSWFKPENNTYGTGELNSIKLLIEKTMARYKTKASYLYGFSAGAAMASNFASLYSQLFDGVLIHSGFPYLGMKALKIDELNLSQLFDTVKLEAFISELPRNQRDGIEKLRSHVGQLNSRLKNIIIVSGTKDIIARYKYSQPILFQFSDSASSLNARAFDHFNVYTSRGSRNVMLYEFLGMGHDWSGGDGRYFFSSPNTLDITLESFRIFGL